MAESGSPNLEVLHCRIRNKGGPNWRLYQDVANLTELVPREGRRKSEETGAKTVEWTVDPESLDHQIHIDISRTSSRSPVRQSIAQPSHKQQRQNPRIVQRNTRTQPPLWRVQGFIDFFFLINVSPIPWKQSIQPIRALLLKKGWAFCVTPVAHCQSLLFIADQR